MLKSGDFCIESFLINELEYARLILNDMVVQDESLNLAHRDEIMRVSQYIDELLNRLENIKKL